MVDNAASVAVTLPPEIDAFLAQSPVEPHADSRLRSLPQEMLRLVIEQGSLFVRGIRRLRSSPGPGLLRVVGRRAWGKGCRRRLL